MAREGGHPVNIIGPVSAEARLEPGGSGRPTRAEAENAVRTLIRWAGDDPDREGLADTPARVARSYEEFFEGYESDPVALLERTFEETDGYDEIVLLRDIRLESYCEHHMVPIVGRAHVAYLPHRRVVGISKLARVVDVYAKRLQIQEKLTAQIANTVNDVLQPRGTAVIIEAAHQCMTTRGVHKPGVTMVTSRMLGAFRDDSSTRRELLAMVTNRELARTRIECALRPSARLVAVTRPGTRVYRALDRSPGSTPFARPPADHPRSQKRQYRGRRYCP